MLLDCARRASDNGSGRDDDSSDSRRGLARRFAISLMPGYMEMHRTLQEGSFPLVSPSSWMAGRLGGEYCYGIFSVFHLGVLSLVFRLALPLAQTANAIILIYLTVFGSAHSAWDAPAALAGPTP